MTALLGLLSVIQSLMITNVPVGSQLRIRMNTPVASWSSAVNSPISAVLIMPVMVNGQLALPAGCTLSGRIKSVTRVGLGIRHERASLDLEFTSITFPDAGTRALSAPVIEVDNGRERVTSTGLIQGVRATSSISYRVSGYIKIVLLWQFHAQLAEWAIKSFVVQLPEPEIYYPAGTELTLSVKKQFSVVASAKPAKPIETLAGSDLAELRDLIASMPFRTSDPESGRPSDLTNVLLVGSRSQIVAAFQAAGWSLAGPLSLRSRINMIRAAAEVHGYSSPMTPLLLDGREADMSWQKGLNDVSKRHHIRVWKQPFLWNGQELWMAAATRDTDFAYLRPGHPFTHQIDPQVDEEREKVAYDLAFTSCATPVAWMDRSKVPHFAQNGTGDSFVTDTRLVVVRLNEYSCASPAADTDATTLIARGGKWQRLLRREILVTRSDFLRSNPYWRIYEASRWTFKYAREHNQAVRSGLLLAGSSSAGSLPFWQALNLFLSSLE